MSTWKDPEGTNKLPTGRLYGKYVFHKCTVIIGVSFASKYEYQIMQNDKMVKWGSAKRTELNELIASYHE